VFAVRPVTAADTGTTASPDPGSAEQLAVFP
jgi:hypothetical protein